MAEEEKKETVETTESTEKTYLKPSYQGQYDDALNDLYKQISNRQAFTYNADEDALYQQYKDRYMQQGQKAMQDTIGQVNHLTGGYANSYAQNVGQQTYDEYLQGLNDKLLETYQLAYQQYQGEGDRLANLFSMAGTMGEQEYNRLTTEAQARKDAGDASLWNSLYGIPTATGGGGGWYGGWGYGGSGSGSGTETETTTTTTAAAPTRGQVARAAESAYASGGITGSQYSTVIKSLH